ncbi:kinase-like protein [Lentinus tigrinus ALCF2SS1-7]|uniref:Kinase-like protein n=1 Tax=Lentinus tigrinus ALCF2SS1-6 TaxID=1328759 RepID=A0A5C2S1S6_9APHY|nr:kinase-like protein [Lentinus tigrinus ALCF2SS1-6]RPD72060.1 kinase-like protein [Lentinus tigrinus ALCF2SS1-7]
MNGIEDTSCAFAPSCFFDEDFFLQEPLDLYRRGYLHPVAISDIIRPDPSPSASRSQDAPSGYRILHKLGKGGEATVWLAQEVDRLDRAVALKIFSADCFSAAEREAGALKALKASENGVGSENVLCLLDEFTFTGPNGVHKVHITEVVVPLWKLSSLLPAVAKKKVATDLARGLAHVHHCGFIHGDIHFGNVGCAMPSGFTMDRIVDTMARLYEYDVTMVVPIKPAYRTRSLPPYLVSPCEILRVYKHHGGYNADQHAKLLDFGNARRIGEEDTDVTGCVCPPPEAVFAYHGCDGLEMPPTPEGDIWCLGAVMFALFTDEGITYDRTSALLLQQAKLHGVIPPAWQTHWDKTQFLHTNSAEVTLENAEAEWTRRRDNFIQENPEVDAAEADLLISLLRQMLATDPDDRPSAAEVLAHRWFTEDGAMPVIPAQDRNGRSLQDP